MYPDHYNHSVKILYCSISWHLTVSPFFVYRSMIKIFLRSCTRNTVGWVLACFQIGMFLVLLYSIRRLWACYTSMGIYQNFTSFQIHRRKVRAWQMICILSRFVDDEIVLQVTSSLHICLYVRPHTHTHICINYLCLPSYNCKLHKDWGLI